MLLYLFKVLTPRDWHWIDQHYLILLWAYEELQTDPCPIQVFAHPLLNFPFWTLRHSLLSFNPFAIYISSILERDDKAHKCCALLNHPIYSILEPVWPLTWTCKQPHVKMRPQRSRFLHPGPSILQSSDWWEAQHRPHLSTGGLNNAGHPTWLNTSKGQQTSKNKSSCATMECVHIVYLFSVNYLFAPLPFWLPNNLYGLWPNYILYPFTRWTLI